MTTAGRTRTNDPEGLKRRVVDAAFHTFTTKGYNATAVQDLIQGVGVSGGAYSHHFASKKQLALAVINGTVAEAVHAAWIAPVRSARSTNQGVKAAFGSIITSLEKTGRVSGCPLNNLALELCGQDADLRAALNAIFAHWREELAKKIRSDQTRGLLKGLQADAAATFIIGCYSGAMAMAKASQTTEPLKICADQLADYLSSQATGSLP